MFQYNILISVLLIGSIVQAIDLPKDAARVKAAKEINDYLDKTVSPCDNFFQFACGNWKNYHELHDGKLDARVSSTLNDNIQNQLKNILEESDVIYNQEVELKIKEFYKSCLKTDVIKEKGFEPIKKFIKSLGDFPILNKNWDESKFNYIEVEEKFKSYGFDGVLHLAVVDSKEKLIIGEIRLPLLKGAYNIPKVMAGYTHRTITFLTNIFGLENDKATEVGKEIIEFEKKISKIVADSTTKINYQTYFVNTTVEELNKKYPKIQWDKFLTKSIGLPVELSKSIVEMNPKYIGDVMELIEKTPKKIVANYMLWHGLHKFISQNMPPLAGNKDNVWRFCATKTKEFYPKEIAVMYSKKYYDNEVQKDIEEMFVDIKKTLHSQFEKLDWFDETTKKLAFEHLDGAKVEIVGFPQGIEVPFESDYNTIKSNPDEYYENIFNKLKYNVRKYRTKIFHGERIDDYVKDSANLLVLYDVLRNVLRISLGIVNSSFYTKTLPKNVQLAQLGTLMIQQLLHGFDETGRYLPKHTWSDFTKSEYNTKSKCLREIYEKEDDNANLINNLTLDGALKYSFETYKQWLESIKNTMKDVYDEEVFPGLEFTNTQLFFLTHAQAWCHYSKKTPTSTEFDYPKEFIINTPMKNYDVFAKEFQCAEGTPMNPKDKCVLW